MNQILMLVATLLIMATYEVICVKREENARLAKERQEQHRVMLETKLMFKRQAFEEYKAYIESLDDVEPCDEDCLNCYKNDKKQYDECHPGFKDVDIKEVSSDELDIKEVVPTSLEQGVKELIKQSHHNYRPYVVNTLDVRDMLREFTVGDVLNTFY